MFFSLSYATHVIVSSALWVDFALGVVTLVDVGVISSGRDITPLANKLGHFNMFRPEPDKLNATSYEEFAPECLGFAVPTMLLCFATALMSGAMSEYNRAVNVKKVENYIVINCLRLMLAFFVCQPLVGLMCMNYFFYRDGLTIYQLFLLLLLFLPMLAFPRFLQVFRIPYQGTIWSFKKYKSIITASRASNEEKLP